MLIKAGYRIILIVWLICTLPVWALAYGFAGGNISFDLSGLGPIDALVTLAIWAVLIAPWILLPFAFVRRR